MEGVWRTRVGYAGGSTEHPIYSEIGDHTECFQVDFDPAVVTYEHLLQLFWDSHDPTQHSWKRQYASLVLAHDEAQLATARASAARMEGLLGAIATRVELLDRFWLAEAHHQKYYLRNEHSRMHAFSSVYHGDEAGFVNSTAAARVNGVLGRGL